MCDAKEHTSYVVLRLWRRGAVWCPSKEKAGITEPEGSAVSAPAGHGDTAIKTPPFCHPWCVRSAESHWLQTTCPADGLQPALHFSDIASWLLFSFAIILIFYCEVFSPWRQQIVILGITILIYSHQPELIIFQINALSLESKSLFKEKWCGCQRVGGCLTENLFQSVLLIK